MKKYLPLGSVVLLEDGEKSVMICGRKQIHIEKNEFFDYIVCPYPEGNLSTEYAYLTNHDEIREVLFTGFINDDETEFLKILNHLDDQNNIS